MLDPQRLARAGGCTGVRAYPRLDRGLLVGAEDELAPAGGLSEIIFPAGVVRQAL